MTQTYNENVEILGSDANAIQLKVRGATGQAQPMQVWQDSGPTTLLEVTEDGRFKVGDDQALQAEAALVEVYREGTSTGKPQRGINTLGTVDGSQSSPVDWVAHELEISGSGSDVISSIHSAVRGQLTHQNSGDSSGATLRGGDFQVVNEVGAAGTPVGEAVGLHAGVSNESGANLEKAVGVDVALNNAGSVNDAIGIEVADVDQGSNNNFAIRTGLGTIRLGNLAGGGNKLVVVDNNGDLAVAELIEYPNWFEIMADQLEIETSGKYLRTSLNTNQNGGFSAWQSTPALNDLFSFPIFIAAGDYKLYARGIRDVHIGILSWYLDTVDAQGLIDNNSDWYSASPENNYLYVSPTFTVDVSGNHVIKGKITGKNPSATNYYFALTKLWLKPA